MPRGASFWHFCSHFCDSHEITNVSPGVSNVFESQSAFESSIVSEMYCFACGTIPSAGTSSPSRPGTRPVSSNISEAFATRRAISPLVIVLLMITSSMSDELGRNRAYRSSCHSAQWYSIATVRPSIQPSMRSRCTKAATIGLRPKAYSSPGNRWSATAPPCCAPATTGYAARKRYEHDRPPWWGTVVTSAFD